MSAAAPAGICDLFGPVCRAGHAATAPARAAVSTTHAVASMGHAAVAVGGFMAHPLASTDRALQKTASGLVSTVLPALEQVTRPELTRAWFLHAYQGAFALALCAFVLLVGWNFLARARGRIGSDELVESLLLYGPLFLAGAVFGPAAGAFLLRFTGALTASVTSFFGRYSSPKQTTSALSKVIAAANPDGVTGGAIVAILFLAALVLAMVAVLGVLLVMTVTLYLTGVIAPLSFVWLVHPHRRGRGLKILNVWVGICFSHVLLFFLLGVVFSMFRDQPLLHTDTSAAAPAMAAFSPGPGGTGGFAELGMLAVAVIALFAAVSSPVWLLRFAPVAPTGAPEAGGAAAGRGRGRAVPAARRGPTPVGGPGTAGPGAGGPGAGGGQGTGHGPGGPAPVIGGGDGGGLRPSAAMAAAAAAQSKRSGTSGARPAAAAAGAAAAAAAGPVGAGLAVARKVAGTARAAGQAAAGHMAHAEGPPGTGEGPRPRRT